MVNEELTVFIGGEGLHDSVSSSSHYADHDQGLQPFRDSDGVRRESHAEV